MTKSKDNIRLLDDGAVTADEQAKAEPTGIQNMLAHLPKIVEGMFLESRLIKIKYDSLIQAGFTEKQAIELCKK